MPRLSDLERIRAEKARRNLRELVRQAWDVVEPATSFIDGWHIGAVCEHLEAVSRGQIRNLIINVPPGHMKLCADSTPIATPDGYRTHGDIAPGDLVFGPDGAPVRVISISPKASADYEVEFSNGEIIKCNGDHLWTVYDRFAKRWRTLDTATLAGLPTERERSRFFIPDTAALQFAERELPLHPYFIGCWLGDGTSTKPCITHDRDDCGHIEKLAGLGYAVTARHNGSGRTVHSYFSGQDIIQVIRTLGLYGHKHIPEIYALASEQQRLELLAGLIDTDGHVDRARGRVRISTCDGDFAGQIERLVLSLGFRAYICQAPAPGYGAYTSDKTVYQVGFNPDKPLPTAITRKRIDRTNFARRRRAIIAIRRAAVPERGHCLRVDRPDGLYVVGRTNLVTHNSLTVCVFWPAWDWIDHPHLRWLFASYSSDLSTRDNNRTSRLINSDWYRARWGDRYSVLKDNDHRIENDKTGFRIASSTGGLGTGERVHRSVNDDLLRANDAHSEAMRKQAIEHLRAMSTRGVNPSEYAQVLIMQRLHEDDPTGWLLADQPGVWDHLCLPAEYESKRTIVVGGIKQIVDMKSLPTSIGWTDPREQDGDLLWPEQFPAVELAKIKKSLGSYGASGQLQQRPSPAEGGIFKRAWWKYYLVRPGSFDEIIQSWDMTFKDVEKADFVAGHVWGRRGADFYLLDRVHDRMSFVESVKSVKGLSYKWPEAHAKCVEDAANGPAVISTLEHEIPGLIAVSPAGGKEARAYAVSPFVEAGNVYLPDPSIAPWIHDFVEEAAQFPNAAHDDDVDAFTQAILRFTSGARFAFGTLGAKS